MNWRIEEVNGRVRSIGPIAPDHDHWAGACLSCSKEDAELVASAPQLKAERDELLEALRAHQDAVTADVHDAPDDHISDARLAAYNGSKDLIARIDATEGR